MKALWQNEQCDVKVLKIKILPSPEDPVCYWGKVFYYQERQALLVTQGSQQFLIDNEDGTGYLKVTVGLGSPSYGHRSIFNYEIVEEVFYAKMHNPATEQELYRLVDEYHQANNPEEFEKIKVLRETIYKMKKPLWKR